MTWLAMRSFAAAITLMLLLLLAGCGSGERQQKADRGDRSGQQHRVDPSDSGDQRAGARHEANNFSVAASQPAEDIEPEGDSSGRMVFQRFAYDGSSGTSIYSMNANGSDLRRLTYSTEYSDESEAEPRWSADMKEVAFVRSTERVDEDSSDPYASASATETVHFIYTMNADGSDERKLLDTPARAPAWSPDGRYIAYLSDSDDDIYVTNADGSGTPKRITNDLVIDELSDDDTDIQWSPDSKKLAFAAGGVIYVVSVSGEEGLSQPQPLMGNASPPASQPSWSPGGTEIAFTRADTSYPDIPSHVYKIDADGSNVTRLTGFAEGKELWPTWSPDGRKIAFVRLVRDSSAVLVMNSDGTDAALLRNFPGIIVRNPDWHAAQDGKSAERRPGEDG